MITRYFIYLSYKGTAYHGWQAQPNAVTVQQKLEEALATLFRERVGLTGAGRTDTGVHASYYVAHFDYGGATEVSSEEFCYHLNAVLPKDIAVSRIRPVEEDMHARFSAVEREYKYCITPVKDPFVEETALLFTQPLNLGLMNEAAGLLCGYDDFTSFAKLHSDVKTNICRVTYARFELENGLIVFTIRADRFLRNMVRAITGTLLEVGRGVLSVDDFLKVVESKERGAAGSSVPAHGLFLTNILYR